MKTNQDHWAKALLQMCENGTLYCLEGESFFPTEGIESSAVLKAMIEHFSDELNDALFEPLRRSKLEWRDVDTLVDDYLNDYTKKIEDLCDTWQIEHSPRAIIKSQLRQHLSEEYFE